MARASVMHSTSFPLPPLPLPPQKTVSFHEGELAVAIFYATSGNRFLQVGLTWLNYPEFDGMVNRGKPTPLVTIVYMRCFSRFPGRITQLFTVYHIIAYPYFGNIPILVGPKSGLVV